MSVILIIFGLLLIIAIQVDIWFTTLTLGGGGPITGRLSAWLWLAALKIHKKSSNHRLLSTVGFFLLVCIPVFWFFFTWLGWVSLFTSVPTAVIGGSDKLPATILERIYFTGFTLSTLGMGDYQPSGPVWQLLTTVASIQGFFQVTLTFAYLIPIVSAASRKRSFAAYITCLGGTPDEIITRAWNGKDFGQFDQHLIALAPMLTQEGESHLTYPILHYFHTVERSRSAVLSVAALDEALTILQYGLPAQYQPDGAALKTTRRAIAAFLNTLTTAYIEPASINPVLPNLTLLRKHQIPTVSDEQFQTAIKPLTQRRRLLLALLDNEGWQWDAISSSRVTNRGAHLDDETMIDQAKLH
ncbi:MAG: two pore domain potassium channel family protein [Microcoleaceae cyanobacterium]